MSQRALYFITCNGKMMYSTKLEADYITRQLVGTEQLPNYLTSDGMVYQQLSLFESPIRNNMLEILPKNLLSKI